MNIVKVAKYRQTIEAVFRCANANYHACVGKNELINWKDSASYWINELELIDCRRAKAEDHENKERALKAIRASCREADSRIAELERTASKSSLSKSELARRSMSELVMRSPSIIACNDA